MHWREAVAIFQKIAIVPLCNRTLPITAARDGVAWVRLMAFCALALLWRRFYAGWASVTARIRL